MTSELVRAHDPQWFKRAVFYEVLVRGFADSDGNGTGDLRGLTDRRWKKKSQRGDLDMKGLTMTLQCTKHYSRPNPEIFQQKVLTKYQQKLREASGLWMMKEVTGS